MSAQFTANMAQTHIPEVRPLDTLIAFKVFAIMPGLSVAERRVAGAIVDHFNRKSGRCDPSIDRLALLLELDRGTVIRALKRLHDLKLLLRLRHGGRSQRNRYQPCWQRLREVDADWRKRFRTPVADVPAPGSHPRHLGGGEDATQTTSSNLPVEPVSKFGVIRPSALPAEAEAKNGLGEKGASPRATSKGRHPAAEAAAERRWYADLHHRFVGDVVPYEQLITAIDEDVRGAATEAELRRRGSGAATVLDLLKLKLPR